MKALLGKHKRAIVIVVSAMIVAATAVLVTIAATSSDHSSSTATKDSSKPDFTTVVPVDRSIKQIGGWKRVSPPEQAPVYAYGDTINGVHVSVSQQPLPFSFKNNPAEKIAELAQKFNASNKIQSGNTTIYVGSSAKGPQSAVFTKEHLLILIKSEKKIPDESWAAYTQSLQPTKLRY